MNGASGGFCAGFRRPYGAESPFHASFPTLKRGANIRCASGAAKSDPHSSTNSIHAIALTVNHADQQVNHAV
jgi:hypothetical protein